MIFSSKATRNGLQALAGLAGAVALAVLAACGGGTTQYEAFVPQRLVVFGDDASVLTPAGRKYAVNGLNATTGQVDCSQEPLWIQGVANLYGFAFAECNPQSVFQPQARTFAVPGAVVDDVSAQVEAQVASGGFGNQDLVLVFIGMNDILDLYRQYPVRSEAALLDDARSRGERLARAVNRLVTLGARVIVSNLPDMGVTPFARSEKAANTDIDRAALMSRLTAAFNEQLGAKVLLDGRYVGLMQMDLRVQAADRAPGNFGLTDVSNGACTEQLPNCTTTTLVSGAVASQYLWADATRLGSGGQTMLAGLAAERAQRNPF